MRKGTITAKAAKAIAKSMERLPRHMQDAIMDNLEALVNDTPKACKKYCKSFETDVAMLIYYGEDARACALMDTYNTDEKNGGSRG